ncbi:hypothetical protein GCM10009800_28050 [Nocardiopsis rhodophaea]
MISGGLSETDTSEFTVRAMADSPVPVVRTATPVGRRDMVRRSSHPVTMAQVRPV